MYRNEVYYSRVQIFRRGYLFFSNVFPGGSAGKNLPANAGDADSMPGLGRNTGERNGKEMETYYNILAWEIPWTEELASDSPWGHKRVRHYFETEQQKMFSSLSSLLIAEKLEISW